MQIIYKTPESVIPAISITEGKTYATEYQTKNKTLMVDNGGENILLVNPHNGRVLIPLTHIEFTENVPEDMRLLQTHRKQGQWVSERLGVLESSALVQNSDFDGNIIVWMYQIEWDRKHQSLSGYIGMSCTL